MSLVKLIMSLLVKKFFAFYNSLPLLSVLSGENPAAPSYLFKIHFSNILLSKGFFPSYFLIKALYVFRFSSIHATCFAHLKLLNLIT